MLTQVFSSSDDLKSVFGRTVFFFSSYFFFCYSLRWGKKKEYDDSHRQMKTEEFMIILASFMIWMVEYELTISTLIFELDMYGNFIRLEYALFVFGSIVDRFSIDFSVRPRDFRVVSV